MRFLNNVKRFFTGIFLITFAFPLLGMQPPVPVPPSTPAKPELSAAADGFWTLVNSDVKFKKIAVGDADEVWAVGEDGKVYQLTSDGWEERAEGIDVGVAEDETVIVVNKNNEVLLRDEEGELEPIKDVKLSSVSVGNNDAIWGIYKAGDKTTVYHFDDGKWEAVKDALGKDVTNLVQFSVNAEEVLYAVDDKGNIYRRDLDRVELLNKTNELKKEIAQEQKAAAKKKVVPKKKVVKKKPTKKVKPKKKATAKKTPVAAKPMVASVGSPSVTMSGASAAAVGTTTTMGSSSAATGSTQASMGAAPAAAVGTSATMGSSSVATGSTQTSMGATPAGKVSGPAGSVGGRRAPAPKRSAGMGSVVKKEVKKHDLAIQK